MDPRSGMFPILGVKFSDRSCIFTHTDLKTFFKAWSLSASLTSTKPDMSVRKEVNKESKILECTTKWRSLNSFRASPEWPPGTCTWTVCSADTETAADRFGKNKRVLYSGVSMSVVHTELLKGSIYVTSFFSTLYYVTWDWYGSWISIWNIFFKYPSRLLFIFHCCLSLPYHGGHTTA